MYSWAGCKQGSHVASAVSGSDFLSVTQLRTSPLTSLSPYGVCKTTNPCEKCPSPPSSTTQETVSECSRLSSTPFPCSVQNSSESSADTVSRLTAAFYFFGLSPNFRLIWFLDRRLYVVTEFVKAVATLIRRDTCGCASAYQKARSCTLQMHRIFSE